MQKHHPKNVRIKHQYLRHLRDAKRRASKSVDQASAAISEFEESTNYKDFALYRIEQATRYKRLLSEQVNSLTGKPLAIATVYSRLMAVKAFFQWLSERAGYRKINYSDADYFNLSANDGRIAAAKRAKRAPSLEQVRAVLASMPHATDIERRDRAIVAFALLSGARDDAIASLCLGHIDLNARTVFQDARKVRTKRRKTITSWFFPVGDDVEAIVIDWVQHLRERLLFGPDDPLFPKTDIARIASSEFQAVGLERAHWTTAGPIRAIFRKAFERAGLPYFHPHTFRTTLGRLGQKVCRTPEEYKAWSQNLGHEEVMTTFSNYGDVADHRQAEIFGELRTRGSGAEGQATPDSKALQDAIAALLKAIPVAA